jgi:2,5-diketo-D-gluconate reductase B
LTPTIAIDDATTIPALGFGTWELAPQGSGGALGAEEAVSIALEVGYRHVDTAQAYGNEEGVGRAIAASAVDRDDVFVTTKIRPDRASHDDVHSSHRESLHRLGMEHVDLVLLHWPSDAAPLSETLTAMTELKDAGLTRHIGVSNFPSALLTQAFELAPVVTDQVEHHPYLGVDAVRAVLRERGGFLTAYSPLAKGAVLHDPVLAEIGEEHGKSPAQVALRWLLQQAATVTIPRSSNAARIEQNFEVFDFELSDDELARIDSLERGERQLDPPWAPDWD